MLAVRTPGAPLGHSHSVAACDSAFPFEGQGRLLRSRSISGLFSRSLYSGLQPPCLRFAVALTGHHARLASRLLARLYRGRHFRRHGFMRFQGATLTDPDVILSHHPARATERRPPPSVEKRGLFLLPVGPLPTSVTCPLRSTGITPLPCYYGAVRPARRIGTFGLAGSLLVPFPLASLDRFSSSVREPK